jgi:serine/threonine protein kinase
MANRRLGEFELLERIGSGGMAEVWRARWHAGEGVRRTVALKVLKEGPARDPKQREKFLEEARLAALLTHSNIAQVYASGSDAGETYMAMEWVQGVNLGVVTEHMRRTGMMLPSDVIAFLVGEIARGIHYAQTLIHEGNPLGLIHRDISPQNVLVSVSGEVKIIDFGIARLVHEDTTGTIGKGKPHYAAPEQFLAEPEPASDLYALGAVLHELLMGKRLRDGLEPEAFSDAIAGRTFVPLDRPGVPAEIDQLRTQLLQRDPAERPRSAKQVVDTVQAWPFHRNAADQVGAIARLMGSFEAPTSGLHEQADASLANLPDGSSSFPAASTMPDPHGDDTRPGPPDQATLPWKRLARAAAFVAVGAIAGGAAAALTFLMQKDDDPVVDHVPLPARVVQPPARRPPPEPRTVKAQAAAAEPEPEKAAPAPPEPEAKPRAKPTPSPKPSRPKHPPPVLVKLRLKGPRLAFVKIGRDEYILEPAANATVRPGTHELRWKLFEDQPWNDGGRITFAPGREHTLEIHETGPRLARNGE